MLLNSKLFFFRGNLLEPSKQNVKFQTSKQPLVYLFGKFDGVHLGHQKLITVAKRLNENLKIVAISFYPHPQKVLIDKEGYNTSLTPWSIRAKLLKSHGVDEVVLLKFTRELSNLTYSDFIHRLSFNFGKPWALVLGEKATLGHKKLGTVEALQVLGKQEGFIVQSVTPLEHLNERVSSARCVKEILSGDVEAARSLLGREYFVSGRIVHGLKRGSQIGFPTINTKHCRSFIPNNGVYATSVFFPHDNTCFSAVTNIGFRPTFNEDQSEVSFETHLLDFSQEVYGKKCFIVFHQKLREERKFSSIEELQRTISRDIASRVSSFSKFKISKNLCELIL
jgi:riboflavin kinase / FMN adenylyltransferase